MIYHEMVNFTPLRDVFFTPSPQFNVGTTNELFLRRQNFQTVTYTRSIMKSSLFKHNLKMSISILPTLNWGEGEAKTSHFRTGYEKFSLVIALNVCVR